VRKLQRAFKIESRNVCKDHSVNKMQFYSLSFKIIIYYLGHKRFDTWIPVHLTSGHKEAARSTKKALTFGKPFKFDRARKQLLFAFLEGVYTIAWDLLELFSIRLFFTLATFLRTLVNL